MSCNEFDLDLEEDTAAEAEGQRAWIEAGVRRRMAVILHPDAEVYVQEAVDMLLDLRYEGESVTDDQVDAVIRECIAYDPASADVDEWAEVA